MNCAKAITRKCRWW